MEKEKIINKDDINLIELADLLIVIEGILKDNEFPTKEYKQWLKKQKLESSCTT